MRKAERSMEFFAEIGYRRLHGSEGLSFLFVCGGPPWNCQS